MNEDPPSDELRQQIEQAKQQLTEQSLSRPPFRTQAAPDKLQPVTSGSSKKPKYVFAITGIVILIAIISIGVFYWISTGHRKLAQSGNVAANTLGAPVAQPPYRLYRDFSGTINTPSKLTLIDQSGKVVSTSSTKLPLALAAQLGNRSLLVEDDFYTSVANNNPDDYGGHYWLIDDRGKLTAVTSQVDKALRVGAGSQASVGILYPISSEEVLYYQCKDYVADSCGTLHRLNVTTGASQTYEVGEGQLRGLSQDGNVAYLLGRNESSMQLISYSLQSKHVLARTDLPALAKNERQFWISPKGNFVAFANEGTSTIKIFSIQQHSTIEIPTPKLWQLNSWSGEVTLPSPKWSTDEQNILFVAWNKTAQYLSVASLATKSYRVIDTLDTSRDAPDSEFGPGLNHHNFDSTGWLSSSAVDYGTTNNQTSGTIGQVTINKTYDLSGTQPIQLPTKYGSILETKDGHPALN